ncbi:MAG: metal ABC transporter substrate-binding protein [Candidatus Edwardsbacteria bacterium]|nr:metal ABC transporter substrate-binding protein [Candidatus Edwardsbacteria bacterium]MBU1576037.1 metal ABC transporter substrate-binding protein [Candidatus Edwardsbacteria bacterium]MBU2463060.1 metal ABC transporter substrate-binding protein [Candidatus Edwardsbacteria bacterium]MBU2594304.1 metal ABC transporter substrate-binding protein [Candidatus Edwardsbacteria bacterium]
MKIWTLSLLSACFLITGCAKKEYPARLIVVTSFYPMYIMTANIVKDVPGVKLVNMAPPFSGCLHDYQMTPQDMKTLSRADILVINGAGMESFLNDVIRQNTKMSVIDASENVELIEEKGTANPHIFVSISGAIQQVRNIEAGLEKADPEYIGYYRENVQRYLVKLEALKEKMQQALKDVKNRNIITFHEAFPYFAREFNLNILAVIEREPGSEPSAGELARTIELVRKNKVKALFAEPQYPAGSARVIAQETGAKVYTLDPAVTGPMEPDAYIAAMKKNLAVLQEALQ